MKDKNLPDDIKAKSLDELREILNSLLTKSKHLQIWKILPMTTKN